MKKLIFLSILIHFASSIYAQWQYCNFPDGGGTYCFAVSGSNVFAGNGAFGVYLSTDNGGNFTAVNSGLTNTNVTSLAVCGTNLFAGTNGGGIFKSADNGSTWTAVNNGLTNQTLQVLSLAVIGTNIFAGTFKGLTSQCGGVFLSTDSGGTWTPVNTGLPADARIFSLAVSGTNLYAGSDNGDLYLTTDSGNTWTTIDNGFPSTDIWALATSGTNVFAGTNGFGVYMSADSGNNWTPVNNGLTAPDFLSLMVNGTNIFAGAGSGTGGVYLSANNGGLWTAINDGLMTDPRISALTISGAYIIAGYNDGGIIMRRLLSEIVNVEEAKSDIFDINLYPNPNNGKFKIDIENKTKNEICLKIYSLLGEKIYATTYSKSVITNEIDLTKFPKGIYFAKIDDGKKTFTKKVVIQ